MSFLAAAEISFPKVPAVVAAGFGFYLLAPGALLESGDEYCSPGGLFAPLPQDHVGQSNPPGLLVRRRRAGFTG